MATDSGFIQPEQHKNMSERERRMMTLMKLKAMPIRVLFSLPALLSSAWW